MQRGRSGRVDARHGVEFQPVLLDAPQHGRQVIRLGHLQHERDALHLLHVHLCDVSAVPPVPGTAAQQILHQQTAGVIGDTGRRPAVGRVFRGVQGLVLAQRARGSALRAHGRRDHLSLLILLTLRDADSRAVFLRNLRRVGVFRCARRALGSRTLEGDGRLRRVRGAARRGVPVVDVETRADAIGFFGFFGLPSRRASVALVATRAARAVRATRHQKGGRDSPREPVPHGGLPLRRRGS